MLFLTGITNGKLSTLGSVELLISGYPVKFYIVPDDFPIPQEGLLGSAFLRGVSTIHLENNFLEWRGNGFSFVTGESLTIPARSRIVSYLRVKNTHLRYGYVPPLSVCKGILIGNAVVSNHRGKAYIQIINTTEEDKNILVPYVQLQEIESFSRKGPRSLKGEILPNPQATPNITNDELNNTLETNNSINDIRNDTDAESSVTDSDLDIRNQESDVEENLFVNPNVPYNFNKNPQIQFSSTKDSFLSRNDNLVVFVSQRGDPCDHGAHILNRNNLLPNDKDTTLARARPYPYKKKHRIITLTIKNRVSELTEREIIEEAIHSLLDVINELGLPSLSVSKGAIDDVPWEYILDRLKKILRDTAVSVTICENLTQTPMPDERRNIIQENHSSAIGGHKGLNKTYKRIRDTYWPGMRRNIQSFIKSCRDCQMKKLVRKKIRQPMILTDQTPDSIRYPWISWGLSPHL
ncbi:hypothetical protein ALC62_00779 [Cyphomyrmex costatus]|uniref:Integrase zinc-binding domain-containing protein n=1 Tax=Cyphomyrmex costatus TaxID=456900 RepID=A0A151IQ05_9HYME|nr:hypothetical protein ALC62_00779 [Cyphomyrmex costatus]